MKSLNFVFLILLLLFSSSSQANSPALFRLHLNTEPVSLDPADQKNSSAGYFLSQIYSPLLRYKNGVLEGDLAEKCIFTKPREITCTLRKQLMWNTGTYLTAQDFVSSWQKFLQKKAFKADLLFSVKNASDIFTGKAKAESLGVQANKNNELIITLERDDAEFLYNLTSPLLTAYSGQPNITTGPYVLDLWIPQKSIKLKNNPNYWKGGPPRPNLEFLFVAEDTVALSLYQKKELSFLRRLPTVFIPQFKNKNDYHEIDQIRFDYIAFGPQIKSRKLKEALVHSLNYSDLQKIYLAKAPPGCPGLAKKFYLTDHCIEFNPFKGKKLFAEVHKDELKNITLVYSKQGGENHKLTMEWIQSQWFKNLGLKIETQALENRIFMEKLKNSPPPIFRRGIAPERPTCLSALETFSSESPENYIQFKNAEFEKILNQMRSGPKGSENTKLCDQALKLLFNETLIIPTGPIYFSILVDPRWTNWNLNELNQLDLSELKFTVSK